MQLLIKPILVGTAIAHMALTEPAPRRSPHHPGYNWESIDYDILSPLGARLSFPCRGAPAGPAYKSYQAGSDIDIHIDGIAKHDGGHCQFSMTYDQVDFAVLKTVMGKCIIETVNYRVKIPKSAPNGNVTFVWTWFNKVGNREMYMNCVDIEITGGSPTGSIVGKKMVIANLPGYPTFPEGFSKDYAKDLYEGQPLVTVGPKGQPTPTQTQTQSQSQSQTATSTVTVTKPTSTPTSHPQRCTQGSRMCKDSKTIGLCWNSIFNFQPCPQGLSCVSAKGDVTCQ